jgi:1-phosphatidylinositol-3-phosphate 5-kinase
MDENLLKVARERPFYVRKDKNPEFYSSINRDTDFLTQHSMMDYSLLVGIDADTDDLVLVTLTCIIMKL